MTKPDAKYLITTADGHAAETAYGFVREPTEHQAERLEYLRAQCLALHEDILRFCPPGRERAVALTNLEQAAMWANKSVAHEA